MLKQFPNDDNTIHPDSESEQHPPDSLAWVADQELAAWHLNKQIADTEICGAILFSQDKQRVSYAGDIIEPAAQQITEIVMRYWDARHPGELARFITLKPGEVDYLLFALPFIQGIVLAVLFEPSYSLSRVRSESKNLLRSLITTTPELPPVSEVSRTSTQDEDLEEDEEDRDDEYEMEDEEFPDIDISNLLQHMPPPDPHIDAPSESVIQGDVNLPAEQAVLNGPSDIPSFFVPPSSQSEELNGTVWEEELETFPTSSQPEVEAESLPQDEDLARGSPSTIFIEEQGKTDPEIVSPFAVQLEEEFEAEKAKILQELNSEQEAIPTQVNEADLIAALEDVVDHVEDAGNDDNAETIPATFSLEEDLILPWEMEESEISPQKDIEEPEPDAPELKDALILTTEIELTNEEVEDTTLVEQEESFLDFLENEIEGIPLPDDETGWLAPFTRQVSDLNQPASKASAPVFSFEEEIASSIPAINHEVFVEEEETPDIPADEDEAVEEALFSFLDSEISVIQEKEESPAVEALEEIPFADLPDAGWGAEITEEVVLEEQFFENTDQPAYDDVPYPDVPEAALETETMDEAVPEVQPVEDTDQPAYNETSSLDMPDAALDTKAIEEIVQEESDERADQPVSEEIFSREGPPFTLAGPVGFPYELPDQIISDTRPNQLQPVPPIETGSDEAVENKQVYTCVLVPNLPENMLAGTLAKKLGEWLPQLSDSFGWELEKITIRPSYLQWTVMVPQGVSTGRLVHNIRIHTSQRIYDHFPELKRRSPEDFWSPSQLIISGEQVPTVEMLESFIQKSRQHNQP